MKRLISCWLVVCGALFACSGQDQEPTCGNGRLDPGEDCDGRALSPTYRSWSCVVHGYHGGEAVCTDRCTFGLEPCRLAGRCGDGVLDAAYEECDPLRPVSCALIGHGQTTDYAACSADCRIDLSPCARCGDGVLQPEFGERVEQDVVTCRRLGYFGGVHTTEDCLTGSTEHCGDYLLLQGDTSLEYPTLASVKADELWLAGNTFGVFPGPQDPACPTLVERLTDEDSSQPGELLGYQWSGCAQTTLMSIRQGEAPRPLPEAGRMGLVRGIFPLGERVALLGDLPDNHYGLRILARGGAELLQVPLNRMIDMMIPRVLPLSRAELAVMHTPEYSTRLRISVFSAEGMSVEAVAELDLRALEWQTAFQKHADNRFLPLGGDRWLFVLFLRVNYPAVTKVVLVRARAVGGWFEPEVIAELIDPPAKLADLRLAAGGGVLEWIGWDEVPDRLRIARWNLDGGALGTEEHLLPEGHGVEWARALDDGRIVLGGIGVIGSGDFGPCPLLDSYDLPQGVFSGMLSREGELRLSPPFHAYGMRLAEQMDYLHPRFWAHARVRPSPSQDDPPLGTVPPPLEDRVYVYGGYPRTEPFCAAQELLAEHLGYPVFSSGVYIVELSLNQTTAVSPVPGKVRPPGGKGVSSMAGRRSGQARPDDGPMGSR